MAGVIIFACIAGIFSLGWHFTTIYQLVLLFLVIVLAMVDGSMFKVFNTPEYKLLQFFVDIPILISLSLLTLYVGIPIAEKHQDFFSGALAFQFIIGCLLVVLVREHERIPKLGGWAPITLFIIVLSPIRKIFIIRKERRDARIAVKGSSAGAGGESGK
jgi:hypothetical protein